MCDRRLLAVTLSSGIALGTCTWLAHNQENMLSCTLQTLTESEVTLLSLMTSGAIMMPAVLFRSRRERLAGVAFTAAFLVFGLALVPLIRVLTSGFDRI